MNSAAADFVPGGGGASGALSHTRAARAESRLLSHTRGALSAALVRMLGALATFQSCAGVACPPKAPKGEAQDQQGALWLESVPKKRPAAVRRALWEPRVASRATALYATSDGALLVTGVTSEHVCLLCCAVARPDSSLRLVFLLCDGPPLQERCAGLRRQATSPPRQLWHSPSFPAAAEARAACRQRRGARTPTRGASGLLPRSLCPGASCSGALLPPSMLARSYVPS